jgi:glycine betaine/proline transport system ATP-binding protein
MSSKSLEHRAEVGAAVRVDDLWKVYGPKPGAYVTAARGFTPGSHPLDEDHTAAVRGVTFQVEPGETFVVMGLSGSGKSTLVRCLTRLIEPTQGQVSFDGRQVTSMSASELRDLRCHECAMVFQHFGLLPHRRVIDNVAFGLEVGGMPRRQREERAREVLSLVGLTGWERSHPSELSGGMRQRVGLARALAVGPRLLLLDEPFSALDPLIRRELQDELIRLASVVNQTSIFITHDMTEALKVGSRIAIMRDGEIVQIGTPEEIVLHPVDDYVRRFAEDASRLRVVQAKTVTTDSLAVPVSSAAGDVVGRLLTEGREVAFVVDDLGRPLGTISADARFSESDRLRTAAEVASAALTTIHESEVLENLMRRLVDSENRLAVVDASGALVGEVTGKAVLGALLAAGPQQPDRLAG